MSEEMSMLSGRGMRVDSSAPQQQEITGENHRPHMSIDELLKVLKGANATPVLLIPSGNGRLSAIAVNGVQNMVPTNREVNGTTEKKLEDFRAWMLLVMSLAASVTFAAGLAPPGGFWSEDKDGHAAGTSVMSKNFPLRWSIFRTTTTFAFCLSLMAIATLAINFDNEKAAAFRARFFPGVIGAVFIFLGASYISGTWETQATGVLNVASFVILLLCMSMQWFLTRRTSRQSGEQPADMSNS